MPGPKNVFRTLAVVLAIAVLALGLLANYQTKVIREQRFLIQQMFQHCNGSRPQRHNGAFSKLV